MSAAIRNDPQGHPSPLRRGAGGEVGSWVELQTLTNFTFLRGGSHPEELVAHAAELGYDAIGITDRNTLAGVVRAHAAGRKHEVRVLPGCRLDLLDGPSLLVYPLDRAGWAELCVLLSTGNGRAEKGDCHLYREDVYRHAARLHCIALPPESLDADFRFDASFEPALAEYRARLPRLSLAATRRYNGDDAKQLHRLHELSRRHDVPLVATNDVHYHDAARRQLQDVLTCIREKCTIQSAGYRLLANAERYLKPEAEMRRLFMHYPEALERAALIAQECTFSLDELQYEYPEEITSEGRTPQEELTYLAWKGAEEIFGTPLPAKTKAAIEYELKFIAGVNYAPYFLTVYDIVRFARSRGILCQGRGSAANSTVCFCLGITSVNPEKFDLLFERFLSAARNEPPDIDVDFEHERREEVIQYIYNKYGRDRAAIVATVTQVHGRGAIRDVGKAMGLSLDAVGKLAGVLGHHYSDDPIDEEVVRQTGMDPRDPHLRKTLELTQQYIGFPRQLGQHTGGFVITRGKLTELCPVLNARMPGRTCIEWNKDDIETLGFLKIDVLALGMLTCIRKAFELMERHYGVKHTLASIPHDEDLPEVKKVYDMICQADTIGVFQIESRAQQSMLPRLRPRSFYDLVIEVAIVRPGPIQGDMVHPYLKRRNGEEPVTYPTQELYDVLHRTLGVPLFQEQAMKIAIVAAGFSPAEADGLRRSMATFKFKGVVSEWRDKLVSGMVAKGYTRDYAERVFKQLEGFGSYGFPESHAASFALLVWVSCWLKCYYPDVFCAALLNSQPMGFYQPAQLVQDAVRHGVAVLPVDVNYSGWEHDLTPQPPTPLPGASPNLTPSPSPQRRGEQDTPLPSIVLPSRSPSPTGRGGRGVRLGLRLIAGLRAEDARLLLEKRGAGYATINALRDAGLSTAALERLADADAFRSLGLDRRQALWELSTRDRPQALFEGQVAPDAVGEAVQLPLLLESEHVVQDYNAQGLSLKAHPVHFLRPDLDRGLCTRAADLVTLPHGTPVRVAGLVLVRQRPGTAKGVWFMTLEDETGTCNLVLFPQVVETYKRRIVGARLFVADGTVQREGIVVHVIVKKGWDGSKLLRKLTHPPTPSQGEGEQHPSPFGEGRGVGSGKGPGDGSEGSEIPDISILSRADEAKGSMEDARRARELGKSRDFR
ncbi:DNA polymerase III subunit alpha [Flaviaesturariibacter flavus]|uniref:Error-prone DNA polymerase n=1 Tax=Flaviaesturariibacter flavus TaxID=2502780 RepID=A0A4R1B9I1_9BACT|nr:error-prone DNA polymerase [Flaviaesturariibacter flavus]TCJ13576.1 DNA polymerase III subunit alpha [Flaviaesturariibacter flavus]